MGFNIVRAAGLVVVGMLALSVGGCATMTRGTNVAWTVESDPVGAKVESSTGWSCETPCTRKLPRNGEFDVTISKPGYKTVTVHIDKRFNKSGAITFAGGPLSAGIDFKNGAAFDLAPNPLKVTLQPEG
jgi:hypothetical protein